MKAPGRGGAVPQNQPEAAAELTSSNRHSMKTIQINLI